ncbi:TPA: LexA family transcriptional regulator [Enterococcus faecium]|nr:LexA family transcriptional regulator [Enterococcus faecium]HAQ4457135.1 LexA family transcriptional regulator [Enterococcus faecium]
MDIGERMKLRRKELNLSADVVAEKLGVSRSTIFRYEKGDIEKLPTNILDDIAEVLKTTPAFLMGWEDENAPSIETIYKQLNPERKTKVYNFAEQQLEEQNRGNVVHFPKKEKLPTIKNSASAANPTELVYGDTVVEEEEFERVPNNADFAVPIIGDSMEPVIRNGQFVFVKEQPDVEDGEIAIVEIDGNGVTCKEVYKDYESQTIILRSINELYEDRVVSPEQIRIIGKVVF